MKNEYPEVFFLTTQLHKLILSLRERQYSTASALWTQSSEKLYRFCNAYSDLYPTEISELWNTATSVTGLTKGVMDASFADLLENSLIPALEAVISPMLFRDDYYGGYTLLPSKSGLMTIQTQDNVFLYGTNDPLFDEYLLARKLYDNTQTSFHIFGAGLLYLPYSLYELSEGSMEIYVYEFDRHMKTAAEKYGLLSFFNESMIHYCFEPSVDVLFETFLKNISNREISDSINYYVNPSIIGMIDEPINSMINSFTANMLTAMYQDEICKRNFILNSKNVSQYLSEERIATEWIVVAGGPSTDRKLDYLKSSPNSKKIIAVSTIYKKLISNGIRPDYVCVLDPQSRTFGHFDGVTDFSPTLVLGADCAWQFAPFWKGEKYLLATGSVPKHLAYYKENNIPYHAVGSTVTSLAIETALALGAQKIEIIGMDLSFPSGKTHASGTMDCRDINLSQDSPDLLAEAENGKGEPIVTSKQFLSYAEQIERIVENHPDVKFINHSPEGLMIKGCTLFTK